MFRADYFSAKNSQDQFLEIISEEINTIDVLLLSTRTTFIFSRKRRTNNRESKKVKIIIYRKDEHKIQQKQYIRAFFNSKTKLN